MIIAGLKLTLLGMIVVYCFLMLLVVCVKFSYWWLSSGSARELAEMEAAEVKKKKRPIASQNNDTLIAVISAAITAHRSRIRQTK